MKIRLYKPVALRLIQNWGISREAWEYHLSRWAGFEISLPRFFWEVHLFAVNSRTPSKLTVECLHEKGWYSVFYSYNLGGDLKKYLETMILRKCRVMEDSGKFRKVA